MYKNIIVSVVVVLAIVTFLTVSIITDKKKSKFDGNGEGSFAASNENYETLTRAPESDEVPESSYSETDDPVTTNGNGTETTPTDTTEKNGGRTEQTEPQSSKSEESEKMPGPEQTEPIQTEPPQTEPAHTEPAVQQPNTDLTYAEYIAMTAAEQEAHFNSFATIEDYFAWYNPAKKKWEDEQNRETIDGDVNIGDLIGGNN